MPRRKAMSDEEVLDRALEVIQERGPQQFTLSDISAAAKLSPATLLQRFGSKELLLDLAVARSNVRLEAELAALPPATSDPRGDLVSWLASLAQPFRTRELLAAHVQMLQRDLTDARQREHAAHRSNLMQQNILARLRAACPLRRPKELLPLAAMVEAHWHGLVLQWAVGGRGRLDVWLRAGLTRFLGAVLE